MSNLSGKIKGFGKLISFVLILSLSMTTGVSFGAEPGIASDLPPGDKVIIGAGTGETSGIPASGTLGVDSMTTTSAATPVDPGISPNTEMSNVVPETLIFSGAATHSVPIVVPPGRGNIAPNLALIYNSYQKNGWLGEGWNLDLGSIQRSTTYGVDYTADAFVATVNGASSELVPRADWGANYYGAKIESAFSKYYLINSAANSTTGGWEVTAKDGTKYFYGSTASSRQDNGLGVFKWCLDKVQDTNGNFMEIIYVKDNGQIYLDRINYTGNVNGLSTAYYVKFFTEAVRSDKEISYKTKSKVTTALRLDYIDVRRSNDSLIRRYDLVYETGAWTPTSRLKSITLIGSDGATALPAQTFTWQDGANGTFGNANSTSTSYVNSSVHAYGDLNGDGRTDFVRSDGTTACSFLSDGNGGFISYTSTLSNPNGGNNGTVSRVFVGEFNGDGRADLAIAYVKARTAPIFQNIYYSETSLFIYISKGDGTFETGILLNHNYWADEYADALPPASDYKIKFADFNGDGRLDALETFSLPASGEPPIKTTAIITQYNGSNAPIKWTSDLTSNFTLIGDPADINGDGKADFILHDSLAADITGFWIFISKGNGDYLPYWVNFGHDIREYSITLTDINGDGLTDLVWPNITGNYVYTFFSTGTGFEPFVASSVTNGYTSGSFADINGDGLVDLIIRNETTSATAVTLSKGDGSFGAVNNVTIGSGSLAVADLRGKGVGDLVISNTTSINSFLVNLTTDDDFPNLLKSLSNGNGGSADISYSSSSTYPTSTPLPFVLHPVASITVKDGLQYNDASNVVDNAMTSYNSYSEGKFDFTTREFRGFGNTTQTKPDGTTIKSWHHQDQTRAGMAYQIDANEANTGQLISRTLNTWDDSIHVNNATFVKLTQTSNDYYDNGQISAFSKDVYAYDNGETNPNNIYGNLTKVTKTGTGVAASIITNNTYENIGGAWMWRINATELRDGATLLRKTTQNYYSDGNLKERISWWDKNDAYVGDTTGDPKTVFTYDSYGNLKTATDSLGRTTTTDYDTTTNNTYPVKVTMPTTSGVSHVVQKSWDYRYGKPLTETDENEKTVNYTLYDVFGRLKKVDYPNGGQRTIDYFDYNANNNTPSYTIVKVKEDANQFITQYQYVDGLGRAIQTVGFGEGGKSIVTRTFYDNMGRKWKSSGPYFASIGATGYPLDPQPSNQVPYAATYFDNRSRPQYIDNHDSASSGTSILRTTIEYVSLQTTTTDPDGGKRSELKDYLGRLLTVTENPQANPATTNYAYNAAGDLRTVTNAIGNQTTIDYDSLGRKISMTDPDMGAWFYTYDLNGNLKTQTDAKGQVTTNTYDELNRLKNKAYSNLASGTATTQTVSYTYDNMTSGANGKGRLYTINNSDVVTTYNTYDEIGQPLKVSKQIIGNATTYATQYRYDVSGKITRLTYPATTAYPSGYLLDYTYHPGSGLLYQVKGASDSKIYAIFSGYEATSQIGQVEYLNGTASGYNYDPQSGRLLALHTQDPSGQEANYLQAKTYHYSSAGDLKEINDQTSGTLYSYDYDQQHRLKTETSKALVAKNQGLTNTYNNTAPLHAVKSVLANGTNYTYSYDGNGNMKQGYDFSDPLQVATRTFTYNAENMPTSISYTPYGSTNSTTSNILYDGEGNRTKKTIGSQSTYYLGRHFEVRNGTPTRYIFAGNTRLAMVVNDSDLYFFHKDHLGSSTVITDATGHNVGKAAYLPYGGDRNPNSPDSIGVTDYKYTDQEHDPETGLYNYNARLYDPATGMFTTADIIVPNYADPQTLNRYAYCRGNPLAYVDPSGHEWGDYSWDDFTSDVGAFFDDPIDYVADAFGSWLSDDPGGGYSDSSVSTPPLYDSGWLSGAETPNYVQPIASSGSGVNTNLPSAWNTVSNFIFGADTYVQNNQVNLVDPWGVRGASQWNNALQLLPNVRIGIDSPVGGATTTLPFNTGGMPITVQTSPSWNIPIGPGMNMKFSGAIDHYAAVLEGRATISTPLSGLRGSIDSNGQTKFNLLGPQLNFPLGYGANAYIGTSW